jgi:hypothetical protein
MDVFSAARKYALNTPWTFACVCIPMAIFSNSATKQAPGANEARCEAHGLGTTSPCSVSLEAGWLQQYNQRQSIRRGENSENVVIHS